jgi:Poly(hydroxyalcanoate) granule associated protein (phasin)
MATRTQSDKPAASVKTKTTASKKAAAPTKNKTAPARKTGGGAEGLLRAGLKALGDARNDVVKRQTHVIESLLGARAVEELKARAFPGLDSFVGFRKFEDVFDKRVATAIERLGVPSAQEIEALREEVRQLREQLARSQKSSGSTRARR